MVRIRRGWGRIGYWYMIDIGGRRCPTMLRLKKRHGDLNWMMRERVCEDPFVTTTRLRLPKTENSLEKRPTAHFT